MRYHTYTVLPFVLCLPCAVAQSSKPWQGQWTYVESWPDINPGLKDLISYKVRIKPVGNGYAVEVDMDGFQTMVRLKASGEVQGNRMVVICEGTREGHGFPESPSGQVHLEFKKVNGKVITVWRGLQPALAKHRKPGVYFRK